MDQSAPGKWTSLRMGAFGLGALTVLNRILKELNQRETGNSQARNQIVLNNARRPGISRLTHMCLRRSLLAVAANQDDLYRQSNRWMA